eukprot:jgi/Tetstr1/461894/TSEL_006972.t1
MPKKSRSRIGAPADNPLGSVIMGHLPLPDDLVDDAFLKRSRTAGGSEAYTQTKTKTRKDEHVHVRLKTSLRQVWKEFGAEALASNPDFLELLRGAFATKEARERVVSCANARLAADLFEGSWGGVILLPHLIKDLTVSKEGGHTVVICTWTNRRPTRLRLEAREGGGYAAALVAENTIANVRVVGGRGASRNGDAQYARALRALWPVQSVLGYLRKKWFEFSYSPDLNLIKKATTHRELHLATYTLLKVYLLTNGRTTLETSDGKPLANTAMREHEDGFRAAVAAFTREALAIERPEHNTLEAVRLGAHITKPHADVFDLKHFANIDNDAKTYQMLDLTSDTREAYTPHRPKDPINACLFVAALSDVPAESVAKIKEALKSGTIVLEKVPDGCDPTAKLIELCVEVLPVSAWNAAMMEHDLAVREGKRKGFSDSIDTRNIAILKMLATDLDSPSRFILRSPILIKAVFDAFNTPED